MARFATGKAMAAVAAAAALMFATSTAAGASEGDIVVFGEVAATATETVEAIAPSKAAVDVVCEGGQEDIDTCMGATRYEPVSEYLGVPYYAQHNGMGGEAWLSLKVGDVVAAEGATYTIVEIRTVATGGDIEQIEDMGADAYLQTCLDDDVHSNVYALKAA